MSAVPRQFAFQHTGLDRAEHLREQPELLHLYWRQARVLILDGVGLVRFFGSEEDPEFAYGADHHEQAPAEASFLGIDEHQAPWFALPADAALVLPPLSLDLRSAATRWPALPASIFAQARALLHWQQRNRFCGVCGNPLTLIRGGFVAHCPHCKVENYPRTDPAIIVAVSDGERLLLGRQASWPERRWSVLAGFMEPGESLEQTVAREVFEEAGVRIHACQYLASQPWPFPSALMLGFSAQAEPQAVAVGAELEDARWFGADELRRQIAAGELISSPRMSISRWLIDDWLARH